MTTKTKRESTEGQEILRRVLAYITHVYPEDWDSFSLVAKLLYEVSGGPMKFVYEKKSPRKERTI